jgi:hypothetical protein
VTVDCPFDCEYLREARVHEKPPQLKPSDYPHQDIRLTEQFLREHEPLLIYIAAKLLEATLDTPGAVDADAREALESLIRTYRTLETGLYYETRPSNPVAGNIHYRLQESVQELRKKLSEEGSTSVRDAEVLAIFVFLERLEMQYDNQRKRGRSFVDYLRTYFPKIEQGAGPRQPSLIQV